MKHTLVVLLLITAVVTTGCVGEAGKALGELAEHSVARTAAREAAVSMRPTLNEISARTVDASQLTVRSEAAAATTVAERPTMTAAALESDVSVTGIAVKSTSDAAGRARVEACARGGADSAARAYITAYVSGESAPDVDGVMTDAISSCLQQAWPNQAAAVDYLTDALKNSMLASSQRAAAQATAQEYADWLVYTASLYGNGAAFTQSG